MTNLSRLSEEELEFAMKTPEQLVLLRLTKTLERMEYLLDRIAVAKESQIPK